MAHSKVTRSTSPISARETVSSGKPGIPLRQKAAAKAKAMPPAKKPPLSR